MLEVNRSQVVTALRTLGLQAGEGVFVHSAIQFLGRPIGGVGMYYEALCEVLDLPNGTLAVPTFNFGFARGEPYDPQQSPSQGMGVFSEYVRQQPAVLRTLHPMQSLAVAGRYAVDLAGRDTPSAFDPGSAFERMLELDFKLLLLGADINAVAMLHYSEQRARVPYRFWKEFKGQVRRPVSVLDGEDKRWEERTYRMFARDMELDARLDLRYIQAILDLRHQWSAVPINYGQLALCRLADFVAAVDECLAFDAWSLLTNREQALKIYRARMNVSGSGSQTIS